MRRRKYYTFKSHPSFFKIIASCAISLSPASRARACVCVCMCVYVCACELSFSHAYKYRLTLSEDGGEWRRTFPNSRSFVYFSLETMQRRGDGHQIGRQGSAIAPTGQSQSLALHVPIDFNCFNDMDVQAPPLEVPP